MACGSCTVKIGDKNSVQPGMSSVMLDGVMSDNIASLLKWAWCINPDKVRAAFKSSTGLDISESDLVTLAKANQMGNDVKQYKVNFVTLVRGIQFTQAERDKASCKVILVR